MNNHSFPITFIYDNFRFFPIVNNLVTKRVFNWDNIVVGENVMLTKLSRFFKNSKGATAIEYALIASLIAVVAIAGMRAIGNKIKAQFGLIADTIEAVGNQTKDTSAGG